MVVFQFVTLVSLSLLLCGFFFQPGDDFGAGSDSDEEEDESDDEEASEDDEEDDSEDDGDMLPIEKASKKLDKKLKKAK